MSGGEDAADERDSDPDGERDAFDALGGPEPDVDDPFDELGPPDSERAQSADGAAEADDWVGEPGDLDDAFEEMDVAGPAEADVWESLDGDALDADAVDAGVGNGGPNSAPGGGETERVVSKRTYCQQCPHFAPPPEVACTHEGTTIAEAVGFAEFRVRNCPMISAEDPAFDSDG